MLLNLFITALLTQPPTSKLFFFVLSRLQMADVDDDKQLQHHATSATSQRQIGLNCLWKGNTQITFN